MQKTNKIAKKNSCNKDKNILYKAGLVSRYFVLLLSYYQAPRGPQCLHMSIH